MATSFKLSTGFLPGGYRVGLSLMDVFGGN